MADQLLPTTITEFTEYMKIAYGKAQNSLQIYNIDPNKLAVITPLYNAYIDAEAIAANPMTATAGARETRNKARKVLGPAWRKFINENIRYNSAVPIVDLKVFRVKERDTTGTPVGIPDTVPAVTFKSVGTRRLEIEVLNSETGKKKKPLYAAGSFIFLAVTEIGQTPQNGDYHKLDFSSNCHHVIEFPREQLGKQANIYARYANPHGKEGPESPVITVIIS
jgi:hypothetical protein